MMTLPILLLLAQTVAPAAAPSTASPHELFERFSARVEAEYDTARGGFVSKSRVPSESAVELAFLRAGRAPDDPWRAKAVGTLTWMRGLLDTLGGGFVASLSPREGDTALGRRADTNGRRLELLLAAAAATGDARYRRDAARVADFLVRVLLDGRGGFVTAQVGDRDLEPASNGVAIHGWLIWAASRVDRRARDFALLSIDRVWEQCWDPTVGLLRTNVFGEIASEPLLADQVEMGRACVLAARLCGRPADRARAIALGNLLIARYEDGRAGFRTASRPRKNGSIQKASKDAGENARAALFLSELAALTGDGRYRDAGVRAWSAFEKKEEKLGLAAADWALAARSWLDPSLPAAPAWAAAEEPEAPKRKRSVTISRGR